MKKVLLILLIPVLLLTVTACGGTHEGKAKDKKLTKTIELVDKKLGFNTTFTYDADNKFSDVHENNEGASTAIYFSNADLDSSFEMYYTTMRKKTYNDTETARSNQKYYKEYTFGDYEAYAYSEYEDKINLNVLLGIDDDTAEVLFVTIERIDTNDEVIMADVLEKDLKEFFESMEFVKE